MASDLASALLSGDSAGLSANPDLAALLPRMRLAQAMQSEGISTAPAHPVAAAARLVQALVGGQMTNDTSSKLQDIFQGNQQQYRDFANTLPGLGGAPSSAAAAPQKPSLAATLAQPPGGATPPSVLGAGGKPVIPDAQGVYGSDATMMPPTGAPDYGKAIAGIETGGRQNPYGVIGPDNGKGQRPVGKYQVMDFNVGPWTKEVLGQAMTPQQFAASPEAQEAVFKAKFDQFKNQTGSPQDAASMWFTGKPLAQGAGRQDALGTTGQSYVDKFNANLGQQPQDQGGGPAMAFSGAPAPAGGAALPPAITAGAQPQGAPQASQAAPQGGGQQLGMGGVTPAIAAMIKNGLASPNPAIRDFAMKTYQQVLQHQMQPAELKTLKDIMGQDVPYWSNPNTQTLTRAQGGPGIGSDIPAGGTAEDILAAADKQLPGTANRVEQLYRGEGGFPNGRTNKIDALAMNIIQQVHPDYNTELFKQKSIMRNDLAKSPAGTIGGIISNGKSAFGHLANLSDKLVELGNYSGPSVPFGGHVGTVGNYVGNAIAPSPETKGKLQGVAGNALKYGQESTKFYSGTGGGEAERMHALNSMDPKTTTAEEQAAFLQTEKELMMERMRQKETQVRGVLGEEYLQKHPIMDADFQSTVKKIDANIARLRGTAAPEAAAGAAAPAASAPAAGGWSVRKIQ